jgi:hypothetical protein
VRALKVRNEKEELRDADIENLPLQQRKEGLTTEIEV